MALSVAGGVSGKDPGDKTGELVGDDSGDQSGERWRRFALGDDSGVQELRVRFKLLLKTFVWVIWEDRSLCERASSISLIRFSWPVSGLEV